MSSNNHPNENIVSQARDFIHGTVQTEEERQRLEQGRKSAFEQAYHKFDNMTTSQKREEKPQQANTRLDNLLDGAVKASMDGVESARKVIYNATKPPEEEELEKRAGMPVHEKAVEEIQSQTRSIADTVGEKAQETKEGVKSVTEDAQAEAKQTLDSTKIKFEETQKVLDEKLQRILDNYDDSKSEEESDDKINFEETKEVVEEKLKNVLGNKKSTEQKEQEDHDDGLIDETMGKIGETKEHITNMAGGVVDGAMEKLGEAQNMVGGAVHGTMEKIGEAKDGATQMVGNVVDGTKEKMGETKEASEKMFHAAVEKLQMDDETGSETDKSEEDQPTNDSSLHEDLVKAGEAALGIDPVEDVKAKSP
eukprot:scaffold5025_cov145-Amphora_coffeaeformis.AAC.8